jgi:DNA-binding PadR family transcriptional regulator
MTQTSKLHTEKFIPLKPNVFSILLVLSEGDAHGYGIKKEVEADSNNQVRLEPGTLYRVIGKLLDDGLIGETNHNPDASSEDERRRYYTLLPFGRQVLVAETERLASLIDSARSRNLISP